MTDQPAAEPAWDGHGLPASARARLARQGPATSLLAMPDAGALAAVGFVAAGEVLGTCVQHIGWRGTGGCGYSSYPAGGVGARAGGYGSYGVDQPVTVLSSTGARYLGYTSHARAYADAYATALRRMTDEAAALGADGVVAVRYEVRDQGGDNLEFLALGTAVRSRRRVRGPRPERPFTSLLTGGETASALLHGLVPVQICVGISVGVRHDDWWSQGQAGSWRNVEINAPTELVTAVRADARRQFDQQVRHSGAETAVVSSMSLALWPQDNAGHRDHVARSVVVGSGLLRFRTRSRPNAPAPLAVLPLSDRTRRDAR